MRFRNFIAFCCSVFAISTAIAGNNSPYGVSVSTTAVTIDPKDLHGVMATAWYQPKQFIWEHSHILFDATYGHWWINRESPNKSLNIFAVSPVFRYYVYNNHIISPFIMLSIGLSYLSKTRIDDRNLGIHFAFQDRAGIGVTLGHDQKFTLIASALHYSNGRMSSSNAGITAPLVITGEYGFG